jgi:hypothetical protein
MHKIKKIEGLVLEKSSESPKETELKLHHTDLAIIEDELKPEFDVLNKLVKLVNSTKTNMEKMSKENAELKSTIDGLKVKLLGNELQNLRHFITVFIYGNLFCLRRITTK